MKCDFCEKEKPKMTTFWHPTGRILFLCFRGCQHFPEPFKATGFTDGWIRIDPWIQKRRQPRLRKDQQLRATPVFRSNKDIEAKKRELLKMSLQPPQGVGSDEMKEWGWYCKGGISALRWIQGREMGDPNADPILDLGDL